MLIPSAAVSQAPGALVAAVILSCSESIYEEIKVAIIGYKTLVKGDSVYSLVD